MNSSLHMIAWMPGPSEMLFIAVFGLLIFGKRLPEVGKSGQEHRGVQEGSQRHRGRDQLGRQPAGHAPPASADHGHSPRAAQPNPQGTVPHD